MVFAAIMYALVIARGIDAQSINFNYKVLCIRLIHCLPSSSFKSLTFDSSPRGQWKWKFDIPVSLYCHCNKPDMMTY